MVEFYGRGGDFREQNLDDLDPDIVRLGLTDEEEDDLVAFLNALTDERVRHDRAPFDHPSLDIPNGGTPGVLSYEFFFPIGVLDDRVVLPAVGRDGYADPLGTPTTPLANFLDPLN